jgi:hypothetical protein
MECDRLGWFNAIRRRFALLDSFDGRLHRIQEALGRIESRQLSQPPADSWRAHEFRVFSQWGEDGLIDHLVDLVKITRPVFVEFGVEDYRESNTRFLLAHRGWSGLVIDASAENIGRIRSDPLFWRYNLKADQAFVTRENINGLISAQGLSGDVGLLSIDIDGNDYWVWEAIDIISPAIVVIEYNARFGQERAVSVPYDPLFVRTKAHYSGIYYGASLRALWLLAKRKGYALVGCNSAGNNAFFVSRALLPASLPERDPQQAFAAARFRESRDRQGRLAFLDPAEEAVLLEGLPLIDLDRSA